MKKLPEFIPEYKIEASTEVPFAVKWEELMGWFLVPKLGEKLSWGMYDIPSRKCSHIYDMQGSRYRRRRANRKRSIILR